MAKKVTYPLVSIGMPVYNGGKYIIRALDSILAQEYKNFQLTISDNASTDQTGKICEKYAKRDKRIKYFRQNENIGARQNFIFLLQQATGEYFMWSAADDFWMPKFVHEMVGQLINNEESCVAMSAVRRMRDNSTIYDIVSFSGELDPSKMSHFKLGMAIASGKKYNLYIYGLYRTDFLKLAASHFPVVVASDRLFVCQVALATKFSYVDEVLQVRNVDSKPITCRYKDDPLVLELRNIFSTEKTLLTLGPYLCNSKIIPFYRKLYIPLLVFRYAFIDLSFGRRLRRFVISHLKNLIRKYLTTNK